MMLADLAPLLTETVQHMFPPERDLFGNVVPGAGTMHGARVTYTPGATPGPASQFDLPQSAATIWLFDHPRPIAIGDTFKLATGEFLEAARIERRAFGGASLAKVFCK